MAGTNLKVQTRLRLSPVPASLICDDLICFLVREILCRTIERIFDDSIMSVGNKDHGNIITHRADTIGHLPELSPVW